MADLKTAAFQALLDGTISSYVSDDREGVAKHYEFNCPSAIAAGDNVILGYLGDVTLLPELGRVTADGAGTALTFSVGHGVYDKSTDTLTETDDNSILLITNAASALSTSLVAASGTQPAGVATRVGPADNRVIYIAVTAETLGENTKVNLDIPYTKSTYA